MERTCVRDSLNFRKKKETKVVTTKKMNEGHTQSHKLYNEYRGHISNLKLQKFEAVVNE